MSDDNEITVALKAIHTEQQKQSKFLQNIYQIQIIMFALSLIAFVLGFAIGTGAIRLQF